VPHIARIYDYWLGGKDNFAADREAAERAAFVRTVRSLPGHWISVEEPGLIDVGDLPAPPDGPALNVLALDGEPLAWVRAHGQAMFAIPGSALDRRS
jgi:hypothetical protein